MLHHFEKNPGPRNLFPNFFSNFEIQIPSFVRLSEGKQIPQCVYLPIGANSPMSKTEIILIESIIIVVLEYLPELEWKRDVCELIVKKAYIIPI